MKTLLTILAVLLVSNLPALGGPNAGGTLVLHQTELAYTVDSSEYPSPPPDPCSSADANIPPEFGMAGWVWKLYAAFPATASPRLKALAFAEQFQGDVFVLAGGLSDPVSDFEISQGGWPTTSGGAVGISFGLVKTAALNEVYWFGGYGYQGALFLSAPHPVEGNRYFVDDSTPPILDAIMAYSSIGFGVDGTVICPPDAPPTGACCFWDGSCQMLLPDACAQAGGSVYGGECVPNPCPWLPLGACCVGLDCTMAIESDCLTGGGVFLPLATCDPNPCATPVEEQSWGRIKATYR
jgi:hypothetical protein